MRQPVRFIRKKSFLDRFQQVLRRDFPLYLMFLPIFAYLIIFAYLPMGGLVIAFRNFIPGHGLFSGDWVGLKWFEYFFKSGFIDRLIINTVALSSLCLLFGFPLPIFFAICVNEIRSIPLRRTVQTVSYLPHFISTVVMVGMMKNFLSVNDGIINNIIEWFGGERISFMMDPKYFRTLFVASSVWQNFGWSSIIYISAITSVDPNLYEAARIDGINKWQEARYITVPSIRQTIIILFIMQLGNIMSISFEKVFLMYNPAVYSTADVISTYVYRKGIGSNQYSFAAAVGMFNSCINFLLVFGANQVCRRIMDISLW